MKTILSIGSNMGDRRGYIDGALEQLEQKAGRILAVSDVIETKAYGLTEQDDFLNLAISLETELQPRQLLEVIHEIEADLDRVRIIRWGPRTIDIDIVFYEDWIIDEEDLHIPHIDFANRTFVLEPVCQIEPDLVDPRTGNTVMELLRELRQSKGDQA